MFNRCVFSSVLTFVALTCGFVSARDLVVSQPMLFDVESPRIFDIAGIPQWGSFVESSISQQGFVTSSFVRDDTDEVFRRSTLQPPHSIADGRFSGAWTNLLWPFSIQNIPFGADTDTFYTIDNSRLDPDSLFLRVVSNRGSTCGLSTFNDMHLELRHSTRPRIEVLSNSQFHTTASPPRTVTDVSASELWPSQTQVGDIGERTEIGNFRFRGITRSNPSSWTTLDVLWAPMVKNPLIETVVPMSQQGSSMRSGWNDPRVDNWGQLPYASNAYDAYVATLEDGPFRDRVIAEKANYTILRKGCTLTAWTMAINAAGFDSVTPPGLLTNLEGLTDGDGNPRNLMRIENIEFGPTSTLGIVPRCPDGMMCVDGANVTPYALQQVYPDMKIRRLANNLSAAETQIVSSLARGEPVVLRLGYSPSQRNRHSVLVYGASAREDGTVVLDMVDTWPRDGQSDVRPTGGLPGDRSRDASRAIGGEPMSLEELDNTFGVTLKNSYMVSRYGRSDGWMSINSSLAVTITTPNGQSISVDTLSGLASGDFADISVARIAPDISIDQELTDDEWEGLTTGHLPALVSIPGEHMDQRGDYTIELVGLQDDDYWLDFWWDGWGNSVRPFHSEGFLAKGETVSFTYSVPVPEPTAFCSLLLLSLGSILYSGRIRV